MRKVQRYFAHVKGRERKIQAPGAGQNSKSVNGCCWINNSSEGTTRCSAVSSTQMLSKQDLCYGGSHFVILLVSAHWLLSSN